MISPKNISSPLKRLIYTNSLAIPFIFFSIYAILGLKHSGEEDSLFYWIVAAISSLAAYVLIFFSLLNRRIINLKELLLYAFPILIVFLFILSGNYRDLAYQSIILFILFVIPAAYIGIELGRERKFNEYINLFYLISLLISAGLFMTIPVAISTPVTELVDQFAGGHYQAMSYFASFAFLITIIYWSFYSGKNSVTKTLFYLLLIFGQIAAIILSGGRGGLVVIAAGGLVLIYLNFTRKMFIPFLSVIILILGYGINELVNYDFGYQDIIGGTDIEGNRALVGASRLVSYIDAGGIDFSQTSNREIYYLDSIRYIQERPLLGYGLFDRIDENPSIFYGRPGFFYPHNLFLEILLHGGIVYLIFWLSILGIFAYKFFKILYYDKSQSMIIAPAVYSFVLLMFSGTYLQEAFFWFTIFYVLSFPTKDLSFSSKK